MKIYVFWSYSIFPCGIDLDIEFLIHSLMGKFQCPNGIDPENKFFDLHELVIPNIYNLWWFVPMKFPENRWRKNFLMNYSVEQTFSDLFLRKTPNSKILDHDLFIEHT